MTLSDSTDDPGLVVVQAADRVLELARTWLAWDGVPRWSEDHDRIYTPHKAIRRFSDHLVDHLAQIEALLAGEKPRANGWHQSQFTTAADRAPFTEVDLNEATERLTRLAGTFRLRLLAAGAEAWDAPRGDDWTLREIAEHVGKPWYAEQVGDLTRG